MGPVKSYQTSPSKSCQGRPGQGVHCPASHVETPPFGQTISVAGGHGLTPSSAPSTAAASTVLSGTGVPPQPIRIVPTLTLRRMHLVIPYVLREMVWAVKGTLCESRLCASF